MRVMNSGNVVFVHQTANNFVTCTSLAKVSSTHTQDTIYARSNGRYKNLSRNLLMCT